MSSNGYGLARSGPLVIFAVCSACSSNGPVFVQSPEPAAGEALFWVTERGRELEWQRSQPGEALQLSGSGIERFFYVLLRESELIRMEPRLEPGVIETVEPTMKTRTECQRDFPVGSEGRRGFPLSATHAEIRELDLERWAFGAPLSAAEHLPSLAVDVAFGRPCAERKLRLTEFRFPGSGRLFVSTLVGDSRVALINTAGELRLYTLETTPRAIAETSMLFGDPGSYRVQAIRFCPQEGRSMLYIADSTEMPTDNPVYRLTRFDLTDDTFAGRRILSANEVTDLAAQAPSTCIAVGGGGLIATSTSATAYREANAGEATTSFEAIEIIDAGGPLHVLAAGDGFVYRGRVDELRVQPIGQASAFGLRSVAAFARPGGRLEAWVTDSEEVIRHVQDDGTFGRHYPELERFPPETPTSCPVRVDECGDAIASKGFSRLTSITGPEGEVRLVSVSSQCPAVFVTDPETLCTYAMELSPIAADENEVRSLDGAGTTVWATNVETAIRLEWP